MLRLFKGTGPGVIVVTITMAIFFWIGALLHPEVHEFGYTKYPAPLTGVLLSVIGSSTIIPLIISLVFTIFTSALIVSFNTGSFFINERTFLPAILYIFLVALFPYTDVFNPVQPAAVLVIYAIMRISDSYRQPDISYNYFAAALAISTGSLLYGNLIWFGVLPFAGLFLLRNIDIRELLITIIGLITPYALLYGVYYVLGYDLRELSVSVTASLFHESIKYEWSRMQIVIVIFLGLTFLISLSYLISGFNSKKVKSRKIFSLLIWTLVISSLVYLVVPSSSVEVFYLFFVPAVCVMTNYYVVKRKKKLMPEFFFSGTIVLIIVFQILRLLNVSI